MTPDQVFAFVQHNVLLILVFLASGAMLLWPVLQRRLSPAKELGTHELTRLINDRHPVVVDVREPKEAEGGKLPNALHIPLSELSKRTSELSSMTSRPAVVYCTRGNRSPAAVRALSKLGFQEVYSLRGGITAWRAAGLPVAK
ncbi:MAG TPA: rhodanese-like domain-containing protein [Casimicrobiaceae bacterium]|nr:rhodanese-like domain-containing protein [Casimicrobiaceae bacterium]